MKKLILLIAILVTSIVSAQEKNVNAGIMTFETETIDYGTIAKNSNGKRSFVFKNTGTTPIVITNVKGSCGCTVATKPNKPVLPNETAVIGVTYATNRVGPFTKTVTVHSNSSDKVKQLKIKGVVTNTNEEKVASK